MAGESANGSGETPRNDLASDLSPAAGENIDPFELARRDMKGSLPKRFYTEAAAAPAEEGTGFCILLDGRPVRTPQRNLLLVPGEPLAQALADEWAAQDEHIDPAQMPLTRIVNSALDGVAREMLAVADDIVKYAGSDLLCYRAGEPETLVAEQAAAWDPVLAWMRDAHGARFVLAEGVMFASQPPEATKAFRKALEGIVDAGEEAGRPLRLAALHVMTTLTGSALLALAVAAGHLRPAQAWAAAHVDEDFQIRVWGEDAEAKARRARRWADMDAAVRVLAG
ncbi:MAG: ATP12 family chaperone protein [Beijerinckiaceae bacterium]